MPALRKKMKLEMMLIGLAESTQQRYIKSVVKLQEYYNKSPAKLSVNEVKNYLLHIKKNLSSNSYNVIVHALRFFYCITLRRPLMKLELPTTKVTYKLPSILSIDEVQSIIKATGNIKDKLLLIIAGLRVSEAVKLRITDIDNNRMTLHIRCSKNGKDRFDTGGLENHKNIRSRSKKIKWLDGVKIYYLITMSTALPLMQSKSPQAA